MKTSSLNPTHLLNFIRKEGERYKNVAWNVTYALMNSVSEKDEKKKSVASKENKNGKFYLRFITKMYYTKWTEVRFYFKVFGYLRIIPNIWKQFFLILQHRRHHSSLFIYIISYQCNVRTKTIF